MEEPAPYRERPSFCCCRTLPAQGHALRSATRGPPRATLPPAKLAKFESADYQLYFIDVSIIYDLRPKTNSFLINQKYKVQSSVPPTFAAPENTYERCPLTPPPKQPRFVLNAAARRENKLARRERCFSLMTSGYSLSQIARMVQASVATVRREIDRALADRRLDAPERFAQVQVARLVKALRLAEAAIELGELKAVGTYLRVVAALDRYHELAAGGPTPRRPTEAPPPSPCPLRRGR